MKTQTFFWEVKDVLCSPSFSLTFSLISQGHLSTSHSKVNKTKKGWIFPAKSCNPGKINVELQIISI